MQAVLLMPVIEQRLSFQTFCFITSDPRIIVKCRWGSEGWCVGGDSRSKGSEKLYFFTSGRQINKIE